MASPVSVQIAASRADASEFETGGNTSVTVYPMYLGKHSTGQSWLGLRWTGASIVELASTTITRARLYFKARLASPNPGTGGTVRFFVQDSAAPLLFTAGTANYDLSVGQFETRVLWSPATPVDMVITDTVAVAGVWPDPNEIGKTANGVWYYLEPPGLKDLIQRCADKSDLASIVVIAHETAEVSSYRGLYSWDGGNAAYTVTLIVEYTAGGGPVTVTLPVASAVGVATVPTVDSPVTVTVPVAPAVGVAPIPDVVATYTATVPVAAAIGVATVPTVTATIKVAVPVAKAIGVALVPSVVSTGMSQITTIPVAKALAVATLPTTTQGAATATVPVAKAIGKTLVPTVTSPVTVTVPVAPAIARATSVMAQPGAITATVPVAKAIARTLVPTVTGLESFTRHTNAVNWIDKTVYPTGTKFYLQVRFKTFAATHAITARLIDETAGDTIVGGLAADVTSISTTMTTKRGTVDLGPYLGDADHAYYVVYGGPTGGTYSCELSEVYYTSG